MRNLFKNDLRARYAQKVKGARKEVARWRRQTGPTDRRAEAAVVRHLQGRGFDTGLAVRTTRATRPQDRDADEEMT